MVAWAGDGQAFLLQVAWLVMEVPKVMEEAADDDGGEQHFVQVRSAQRSLYQEVVRRHTHHLHQHQLMNYFQPLSWPVMEAAGAVASVRPVVAQYLLWLSLLEAAAA